MLKKLWRRLLLCPFGYHSLRYFPNFEPSIKEFKVKCFCCACHTVMG